MYTKNCYSDISALICTLKFAKIILVHGYVHYKFYPLGINWNEQSYTCLSNTYWKDRNTSDTFA